MPKLKYTDKNKKITFKLDDVITLIGRDDICNIVLDDEKVSKKHCRIERDGNLFYIEDLTSRNGTYVNNKLVSKKTQLKHNDIITVGSTNIVFHNPEGIRGFFWFILTNKTVQRISLFILIIAVLIFVVYLGYNTLSKLENKKPRKIQVEENK